MKKYFIGIIMTILFFGGVSTLNATTEVAFELKHFPKGQNYLRMDNFQTLGSGDLEMIHPVRVKPSTTYTLIMSYAAMGGSYDYVLEYETLFHLPGSMEGISLYGTYTEDNMHVYYTFTTLPHMQFLMISEIMSAGLNDEMMLYEGVIEDFAGYVMYEGPDLSYGDYPTFSNNAVYLVNVDFPLSIQVIQSSLMAYDNVDGDLTSQIVILEDNYSAFKHEIGDHTVVFSVTDSSNNQTTFHLIVRVVDITAPTIDGPNVLVSRLSEAEKSAEGIRLLLTAFDNVDGDLSSSIRVVSDGLLGNARIPGTYEIIYEVTDSYGNATQQVVFVEVKDDIAPVITGPTRVDVFLSEEKVTIFTIKEAISVNDNIDGPITHKLHVISDPFTGNERTPGEYDVVFGVTDAAGNSATKVVRVVVKDDVAPIIWVDHMVIPKTIADALTLEDIKLLFLMALENQGILAYDVSVVSDEYSGNEQNVGNHYIHLTYKTLSGQTVHERLRIAVIESIPKDDQTNYALAFYGGLAIVGVIGCGFFYTKRK